MSKIFYTRLERLGFDKYEDYLTSPHWKAIKINYKKSDFPHYCIICNNNKYQLHHRSYRRLGIETTKDLIPLCGKCHTRVHKLDKEIRTNLYDIKKVLHTEFGFTKREASQLLQPFNGKAKWDAADRPKINKKIIKLPPARAINRRKKKKNPTVHRKARPMCKECNVKLKVEKATPRFRYSHIYICKKCREVTYDEKYLKKLTN